MKQALNRKSINNEKVLILTTTFPRWRGDSKPPFVYELSKRLARSFDVRILTPNCAGARAFECMDGMQVRRFRYFFKKFERLVGGSGILPTLRSNKWYYLQIPFFVVGELFSLIKEVRKIRPNIIHAHWIPNGFFAALIKKLYPVSLVVTAHGSDVFGLRGALPTALKKFTLRNADRITAVSDALRKEMLAKIEPDLTIEVISMGVDRKQFSPDKRDNSIRKKYNIQGPFLLFVGRLIEVKGVRYLIEAMYDIVREYPKTKLLIVGQGTQEKELRDLTARLKLLTNIVFTGEIPNFLLPSYYATADVFICPSVAGRKGGAEGLGLSLVEAALSGCVAIGSDIAGITDVIIDGITGFLVEQKNARDISNRVIAVLKDRSLADRIRKQARNKMLEKFDWDVVSSKYEQVLRLCILERFSHENESHEKSEIGL